jgi:uncharacterized membrane protein YciS (DUF1049 family)
MRKLIFWIGFAVIILSIILIFLSGVSRGPNSEPIVPFLYGINQVYYMLFGIVGLILLVAGLIFEKKLKFHSN